MIATLALVGVVLAGLWLVAIGGLMGSRPRRCLELLALMASTWRINLTELGLRALAGVALVARAEASSAPDAFRIIGWFLIVSALVILAIPIRIHAGFSRWWAARIATAAVRALALPTILAGGALVALAI